MIKRCLQFLKKFFLKKTENSKVCRQDKTDLLIVPLAKQILNGTLSYNPFEDCSISLITNDIRINNCYVTSGSRNAHAFFKLGVKRFNLKNYGKRSEQKLLETLIEYLEQEILLGRLCLIELPYKETVSGPLLEEYRKTDLEALIQSLCKEQNPKACPPSLLAAVRDSLQGSDTLTQPIAVVATEIGMKWPFKSQSGKNAICIGELIGSSVAELMNMKGMGRKKVCTYIACLLHLYKKQKWREDIDNHDFPDRLQNILSGAVLSEREKQVLQLRLDTSKEKHTLAELGKQLELTRERIRQIEIKALRTLQLHITSQQARSFLEKEKESLWHELAGQDRKIAKGASFLKLASQLSFEKKIAIELTEESKPRRKSLVILQDWLSCHYPEDEYFWYKDQEAMSASD